LSSSRLRHDLHSFPTRRSSDLSIARDISRSGYLDGSAFSLTWICCHDCDGIDVSTCSGSFFNTDLERIIRVCAACRHCRWNHAIFHFTRHESKICLLWMYYRNRWYFNVYCANGDDYFTTKEENDHDRVCARCPHLLFSNVCGRFLADVEYCFCKYHRP